MKTDVKKNLIAALSNGTAIADDENQTVVLISELAAEKAIEKTDFQNFEIDELRDNLENAITEEIENCISGFDFDEKEVLKSLS